MMPADRILEDLERHWPMAVLGTHAIYNGAGFAAALVGLPVAGIAWWLLLGTLATVIVGIVNYAALQALVPRVSRQGRLQGEGDWRHVLALIYLAVHSFIVMTFGLVVGIPVLFYVLGGYFLS